VNPVAQGTREAPPAGLWIAGMAPVFTALGGTVSHGKLGRNPSTPKACGGDEKKVQASLVSTCATPLGWILWYPFFCLFKGLKTGKMRPIVDYELVIKSSHHESH
jgi:hypothetical protein